MSFKTLPPGLVSAATQILEDLQKSYTQKADEVNKVSGLPELGEDSPTMVSNCCGAVVQTGQGEPVCPACKEHCTAELQEGYKVGDAVEFKDKLNGNPQKGKISKVKGDKYDIKIDADNETHFDIDDKNISKLNESNNNAFIKYTVLKKDLKTTSPLGVPWAQDPNDLDQETIKKIIDGLSIQNFRAVHIDSSLDLDSKIELKKRIKNNSAKVKFNERPDRYELQYESTIKESQSLGTYDNDIKDDADRLVAHVDVVSDIDENGVETFRALLQYQKGYTKLVPDKMFPGSSSEAALLELLAVVEPSAVEELKELDETEDTKKATWTDGISDLKD